MKKILFVFAAAVAIMFASCGNKTNEAEAVIDTAALQIEDANTAADEMITNLTQLLNNKDVNAFQAALDAVKAKIEELTGINADAAKAYMTKIQDFLKDKSDLVKSVVGTNAAVTSAVNALTENPVESFVNGIKEKFNNVKDATTDAVKEKAADVVEGANDAVDAVKEAPAKAAEAAKEKAGEAVDNAAANVKKGLGL